MAKLGHELFTDDEIMDWDRYNIMINAFNFTTPPRIAGIYRGHSKSDWDLVSSFYRQFKSQPLPSTEELLKIEYYAKREFFSQAHLSLSANLMSVTKDDLESWMLMQHHHAPTRLLDWTLSPYVAAYYACRENVEEDGAVWLLHGGFLHQEMRKIYNVEHVPPTTYPNNFFTEPDSTAEVFFANPKTKTDRMAAQQGIFTVCRNISGIQHDIISNACKEEPVFLRKVIIPSDQKVEFLRKLHAMNITANSLFPGLDGLGQSVKELVLLNAHKMKVELIEERTSMIRSGGFLSGLGLPDKHDKK